MTVRELDAHVIRDLYRNGRSVAVTVNDLSPVPIEVLISHCWDEIAGRFLEDVLQATEPVGDNVGFFICFLSQYQGTAEEIDAQVKQGRQSIYDGIFARLLQQISSRHKKLVIVIPCDEIVDQDGLYARMWCAWEIFNAFKHQIPVRFYFPGRSGNTLTDYMCGKGNETIDIRYSRCGNPHIPMRRGSDEDQIREALQAKHPFFKSFEYFDIVNNVLNYNSAVINDRSAQDGPRIIEVTTTTDYSTWNTVKWCFSCPRSCLAALALHILYHYIMKSSMIVAFWRCILERNIECVADWFLRYVTDATWYAGAPLTLLTVHICCQPTLQGWFNIFMVKVFHCICLVAFTLPPQIIALFVLVHLCLIRYTGNSKLKQAWAIVVTGDQRAARSFCADSTFEQARRSFIPFSCLLLAQLPYARSYVNCIAVDIATIAFTALVLLDRHWLVLPWSVLPYAMSPYGSFLTDAMGIAYAGIFFNGATFLNRSPFAENAMNHAENAMKRILRRAL